MDIRERVLQQLKGIINDTLKDENVRVYLFGSWARQEEKASSDIDIAIDPSKETISSAKWVELVERVEESTIPYNVDIVNMKEVNGNLVHNIRKEGVLWKDFEKE
ncbi:nucleotidyltransferase domain-containing protein [Bacillus sp. IITD106]|nr:nucleotidyltransferase domain-containing protein [Bacillus sp. IITD106]